MVSWWWYTGSHDELVRWVSRYKDELSIVTDRLRNLGHELHPSILEILGLVSLRRLLEDF